ncbi:MAG TPA: 16S rRNA (guanine(966)-N(2))-methyltransferase RsmD [Egibacteraceae bacterium]|nr:16S rRNA (guanine(966)-N(2))-methyltransferase RsmD [Egibacteraceae bacterium]
MIAGSARSRRLEAPPGRGTRPTSDRVREALFSSLAPVVADARVLDLYAGSGALGIEALSRGAEHAVFVERDPRAAAIISANLERTGLAARATVRRQDAARFAGDPIGGPFDLVLADPPYTAPIEDVFDLLGELRGAGALADSAVVVIERDRRATGDVQSPPWLALERARPYGGTLLLILRVAGETGPQGLGGCDDG